jgi:mannan endo-1,4-beta-mannosidase
MILHDAWFDGGYQLHYKPFAEAMVSAFKDHPAIFAWELRNELKDAQNPPNIVPFVQAMASRIRQLDPNHMITTGFLSWIIKD